MDSIQILITFVKKRRSIVHEIVGQLRSVPWYQDRYLTTHAARGKGTCDTADGLAKARGALSERGRGEDGWVLSLEDDIFLGSGFARIPALIQEHSQEDTGLLSFFSTKDLDEGVVEMGSFCYAQAVAVKAAMLGEVQVFSSSYMRADSRRKVCADWMMGELAKSQKRKILLYSPSLVQHRLVESTVKGRTQVRRSPTFQRVYGASP